jgi:glycosyltransferase involved in cell wall biosynthesis
MNLLFLTETDISPLQGGTERITCTLSEEFTRRGYKCFLAYERPCGLPLAESFAGKLRYTPGLEASQLEEFLKQNCIDIIISNLVDIHYKYRLLPLVRKLSLECGAKVVACLHAMPGEEMLGNSIRCSIYLMMHGGGFGGNLKDIILKCTPKSWLETLFRRKLRSRYRVLYDNADKVVLLSASFYDDFARLGEMRIDDRFAAIGNALSFDEFLPEEDIPLKQKEVMMLSRMDEKSKRISAALEIWKEVNDSGKHDDWKLTIVGGGRDLPYFKKMAERMKLRNVSFEGRQEDSLPYYRRSSIFMMTSNYEGWGITLTEAQQMGVVPIAFYSYASLPEIIDDGRNGVIVPNRDERSFCDKLLWLMDHPSIRAQMASEAIRSSRRFTGEKIGEQWMTLFTNLLAVSKESTHID